MKGESWVAAAQRKNHSPEATFGPGWEERNGKSLLFQPYLAPSLLLGWDNMQVPLSSLCALFYRSERRVSVRYEESRARELC